MVTKPATSKQVCFKSFLSQVFGFCSSDERLTFSCFFTLIFFRGTHDIKLFSNNLVDIKLEEMEQGDSQSSGNEEAPYTVVVQIPNPYGEAAGEDEFCFNSTSQCL